MTPTSTHPVAVLPGPCPTLPTATYRTRWARNPDDVRNAQRLRFQVFNVELKEGLSTSFETGLDEDPFDAICDHLLVEHLESGSIVGTYRMQTGRMAALGRGYYSAQEFSMEVFESRRDETLELGRACIDEAHRSFAVLSLLWRGIAGYAVRQGSRYLVGCSSLKSTEPSVGTAAYQALASHLVEPCFRTVPLPHKACLTPAATSAPPLPRLFQAYLGLGARICGPPALDREFGTVDFLTLLDLRSVPQGIRSRWGLGQVAHPESTPSSILPATAATP